MKISRRALLANALAGTGMLALTDPARALIKITVTGGDFQPLPIGIPPFSGIDPQFGSEVATIVAANLRRSGLFAPIEGGSPGDFNVAPDFGAWRGAGADALLVGQTEQTGGRARALVRLWDVIAGEEVFGQTKAADLDHWRRIAHIVSDEIYTNLTGEGAYFDSQVVFISESGPRANRVKRLAIMDQDGANPQFLTDGNELVLTPRYSPNTGLIAYTRYINDNPQIFLYNFGNGRSQQLPPVSNIMFSQRFSPDGGRLVFSAVNGANTNLYFTDLASGRSGQLTSGAAIDTSPSFSPDGSQLAFESDRGGSQQIYVMSAGGGGAQRISFGNGRYSTPVWSPLGDLIAFTRQSEGQFSIGTMRPDGSGERILTSAFLCEGPTWAPNGRVLMFWQQGQGAAGPSLSSVDIWGRSVNSIATPGFASDPAWSPLLG